MSNARYMDTKYWKEYINLIHDRPELFTQNSDIYIVTDEDKVEQFVADTGINIGLVYRSSFRMMIVDLVSTNNHEYAYERVIPVKKTNGVAILPIYNNKFILLQQFRHPVRGHRYEIPRGFSFDSSTIEENAMRELGEELGSEITKLEYLGDIEADSGLTSGKTSIYVAYVTSIVKKKHYEGIYDTIELSDKQIKEYINRGDITDSFTIAAYTMYKLRYTNNNTF